MLSTKAEKVRLFAANYLVCEKTAGGSMGWLSPAGASLISVNARLSGFWSENRILLTWKELFLKDIELRQILGEFQTLEEKMTASEFSLRCIERGRANKPA